MATGNIVNICNRALLGLGGRAQISNLQEASTEANACSVLFQPCYEALARSAYWNCLRNQATLSLIQAAAGTPENPDGTTLPLPPAPWLYAYLLPSDNLQARYIVPTFPPQATGTPISPSFVSANGTLPGRGQIPFQVAYGTDPQGNPIQILLTNQTQAQLVYTVNQPNPQIWDSLFSEAMVQSLCAYLVPALSLSAPLMTASMSRAEKMIEQARIRDGDEGSTCQDNIPDWITARNGGSAWNGYGNAYYGAYQGMVWPG